MPLPSPIPNLVPALRDGVVCLRALQDAEIPASFVQATDVESAGTCGPVRAGGSGR